VQNGSLGHVRPLDLEVEERQDGRHPPTVERRVGAAQQLEARVLVHADVICAGPTRLGCLHRPSTQPQRHPRHPGRARPGGLRADPGDREAEEYLTDEHIAAWTAHLAGPEQQLRLLKATPAMLTAGRVPEYLLEQVRIAG
jgi:hypothetical protein